MILELNIIKIESNNIAAKEKASEEKSNGRYTRHVF
jgi:hypothetical protein